MENELIEDSQHLINIKGDDWFLQSSYIDVPEDGSLYLDNAPDFLVPELKYEVKAWYSGDQFRHNAFVIKHKGGTVYLYWKDLGE